ncbi:hypothetical protein SLE2022_294150 [Rubroshorea leprosula]
MFGRVRAPSSSPESLERPPPKIIKDDPLSVYEATLMKLRVGSQRHLHSLPEAARDVDGDCSSVTVSESPTSPSSPCAEMMTIESNHISANLLRSSENVSLNEEAIMMDTDDSVESVSLTSSDDQSTGSLKQHGSRNVSVLYLFTKFKDSQRALSSSREAKRSLTNGSVSFSSDSGSQSLSTTKGQEELESTSSFPVNQIQD